MAQEGGATAIPVTMQALLLDKKAGSRLVIYVSSLVVFAVQAERREPSSLLLRPNLLLVRPRRKPCPTTLAS